MIHSFLSFSTDGAITTPPANAPFGLDTMLTDQGFQVDDPTSPDFSFVQNIAAEMFLRSSAEAFLHPRTRNADINDTFDEDPDPTYWPKQSVRIYFQPQPQEFELTKWGADLKNKMEIIFFRSTIISQFGERMIQIGDLIEAPYRSLSENRPRFFRVSNSQEFGNYRYQWLYIKTQTELLTGEVTIRPPAAEAQPQRDFPLDL